MGGKTASSVWPLCPSVTSRPPVTPRRTGIWAVRIPHQEAPLVPEPDWEAASIRRLSVQIQEEGFMAKWGSAGVLDSFHAAFDQHNPVRGEAGMGPAPKSTQTLHHVSLLIVQTCSGDQNQIRGVK